MKPIHAVPAWATVDTRGRVRWDYIIFTDKATASEFARYMDMRLVRVEVRGEVRKTRRKRKNKR